MLLTVELRCNTWRQCLFLARGMSIGDASPCASVSLMFRLHKPERRHLTHPGEGIVSLNLLLQGSPELRQALIGAIAAVGGVCGMCRCLCYGLCRRAPVHCPCRQVHGLRCLLQ